MKKKKKVGKASPSWTVTPALRDPRPEPACITEVVHCASNLKNIMLLPWFLLKIDHIKNILG